MSYYKIILKLYFYFLQKLNAYSLNIHLKYFFYEISLCQSHANKQTTERGRIN
jgi:hypothetical protein